MQHAIKMWMVQPGKHFDYIARTGKKMGFDIDDRWYGQGRDVAIKVTYIDQTAGSMKLVFNGGTKAKSEQLLGDGKLKTVTFMVADLVQNSMAHDFDFTLESGNDKTDIVVSMVRVVATAK
ncbi:hypothetical protein [Colwellia piezophila]|uniref:hypothetical protein n=1 Tax=Colwellia piezophila TaxID=211668 RepID=UPI00036A7C2D|nr:hypothetical protein [Colwellia piezophila]